MKLPRFLSDQGDSAADPPVGGTTVVEQHIVEINEEQLRELSNVFSAPKWLRDAGLASWLLAGVALLLAGGVWLAAATSTIVDPVVVGFIVAVVASPVIGWLGVFLTGSVTSSAALFGKLQQVTATHIGLNPVLTTSANLFGGVMGKLISPQSIAVACAATALVGRETDIFRKTIK